MKQIRSYLFSVLILTACFSTSCGSTKENNKGTVIIGTQSPVMILGTYAALPRLENGRADIPKLIYQLNDLNANTYNWLIWTGDKDWDDLKLFLPEAKKHNISVWVSLVPPSESKPIFKYSSEPYGLDYIRWSKEIALLSAEFPNLIAFSIDDFVHNIDPKKYTPAYTPEYVGKMMDEIDKVNPDLKFIPCSYYKQIIKDDFAKIYGPLIDGILFPYRAESEGANLNNPDLIESEIAHIRTLFEKDFPIYIDLYSTAHSRLGSTTPAYIQKAIKYGSEHADGVLIYKHPNPTSDLDSEKYKIVKDGFARLSNFKK
ncbi:MAG: hypothetical protein PHN55_08540 [Dysgonamonadaceae bacterium]|nr:hypothetical protein [Dysgonamonadaceae bacterium]